MIKAQVALPKSLTIPQMDLTAAAISTIVSHGLKQQLDCQDLIDVFWTDSQVVLCYTYNEVTRLNTSVANRIQKIHNYTKPKQWHHVRTESNQADAASHGLPAYQLVGDPGCIKQPEFL